MQDKPDLQQIWSDVDWSNDTIIHLRQQIKEKIRSGIDLNMMSKRVKMIDVNVPKIEEFTIYDLVMDKSYRGKDEKSDHHWFAVMSLLRGLGAKPACQLIAKMSAEEKAENELDSIRILKKWLFQYEASVIRPLIHPER